VRTIPVLFTIPCTMLLGSCAAPAPVERAAERADVARAGLSAPAALPAPAETPSLQAMWAEQKLIRSADLRIQVRDVTAAVARADTVARAAQALLADTRIDQDEDGRHTAVLVIRVPAERFTPMLEGLRRLGQVKADVVSTEDVTKAYTDLATRLAVKEETAARLRRLLADRTGKLSDVLEVERELSRVITEIEQMKGERRYYDQRIAVSTITVTLFEPGAFLQPGSGAPLRDAFGRSLRVLAQSIAWLIYLVTFLAPWVAIAALGWWLVRLVRARKRAG